MNREPLDDIEYEDKGCWYHGHCLTCPFGNDCIIPDSGKPLSYEKVRALKKQYPFLKGRKVEALQNGKVVMV